MTYATFAFVEAFATALAEDHMLVHVAHAEAEIACGRANAVIGELEALAVKHPYHEPLWAQLITAYYCAERQSDALDAYRRLKAVLAEDLGIDPGPTVSALHARILRQERLDPKQSAKTTAAGAMALAHKTSTRNVVAARLRDAAGKHYPLQAAITRIGRLPDNDIVLEDDDVSRHHAVIIDTGDSFVIADLRSANGVYVQGRRLRPSATLAGGDQSASAGIGSPSKSDGSEQSEFVLESRFPLCHDCQLPPVLAVRQADNPHEARRREPASDGMSDRAQISRDECIWPALLAKYCEPEPMPAHPWWPRAHPPSPKAASVSREAPAYAPE